MSGRSYAEGRLYAEDTKTPVVRSKAEVEKLLRDCGATKFISGWDASKGVDVVQCFVAERMLRFEIYEPTDEEAGRFSVAQEHRRRWRVLVMLVKAKLEAVRSGDSTIEDEFLANLVLPDGKTVGAWARPQLAAAYEGGEMPLALLPGAPRVRSRVRKL